MVETAHHGHGEDGRRVLPWIWRCLDGSWNRVRDPLMRPGVIVGVHVRSEHPAKMALVQDQEMIETLPADTAEEALTDGIAPGSMNRSPEHLDSARCRDASYHGAVLAVVVTDEVAGSLAKRRRFTELLGDPPIRRMGGHSHMNNLARPELQKNERDQ